MTRELILGSDATRGGAEKASVSPPTLVVVVVVLPDPFRGMGARRNSAETLDLPPLAEYYEKYSQNVFYLNLTRRKS